MDQNEITEGTYITTRTVEAVRPDKRKRYDWRAGDIKKGTFIRADDFLGLGTIVLSGGAYDNDVINPRQAEAASLVASLERVVETPSMLLRRKCGSGCGSAALGVLDTMCERGLVTAEQVSQMERADVEAEEAALKGGE